MNTETTVFDLPDWLNEQLSFERENDLHQGHVAEIMYNGNRPYYSLGHFESELKNYSRDTIRTRLNKMTEMGVLKKETVNNGDVWWISYSKTDWPKPPDTEVTPVSDETTVSEFLSRNHVFVTLVSILAAAGSGVIVWVGTLQSAGRIALPFETSWILALGLSVILVSYLGIFISAVFWIIYKSAGGTPVEFSLSEIFE